MFQVIGAELTKMTIDQLKAYLGSSLSTKEATTVDEKEDLAEQLESEYNYWKNFEPRFWGKLLSGLGGGAMGFLSSYNLRRGRMKLF